MANKKIRKVKLDKNCLLEALRLKNSSIRKIGSDCTFGWSSKSIERGIRDGEASPALLDALGRYLDVDPDYLAGKYHRQCECIKNDSVSAAMKKALSAKKFPYIEQIQRSKENGKTLEAQYLEHILAVHDISMRQYEEIEFEKKKQLQLEIEDAIVPILRKHFPRNAAGLDIYPEIYRLRASIDNYDPNEPVLQEALLSNDAG